MIKKLVSSMAILMIAMMFVCPLQAAETLVLGWDNPTVYVDGTQIADSNALTMKTVVEFKAANAATWNVLGEVSNPGNTLKAVFPREGYPRGESLQFRAKAVMPGVDQNGKATLLQSDYSNVADYTIPTIAPESPRELIYTITLGNLQSATLSLTKKAGATFK